MTLDIDLQSIQEVRDLISRAYEAKHAFRLFSQEQVDKVVHAMAEAGFAAADRLGRLAYEETGFGKPADKKRKNEFATRRVWESIRDLKTVGVIRDDKEKRILEIAEPMGVVAALVPSTNPTSTLMFKAIISLKGRNSFVASPHPKSVRCTLEATRILSEAAEAAGAPEGLVNCMSIPTAEGTQELMKHRKVAVILATGSGAMVKAAYSAGKPAYGVGPGNVPSFIERTANVRKAVADVVSGKMFDWGVLCSTESAVIVDEPVKKLTVEEFKRRGAYFVSAEERERLNRTMFDPHGHLNPEVVGKAPFIIAKLAGFDIPHDTSCIVAELPGVGKEYPLSREKLSPVLAMFMVNGWREGCERSIQMLEFGGLGHTMVIHSSDSEVILKFGLEKPANRILVNTQSALGAVGYTNELNPSLTLGPGTFGGSIISENVSAKHLINIKRVAFETRPINSMENFQNPAAERIQATAERFDIHHAAPSGKSWIEEIEERIRLKAGNVLEKQKEGAGSKEPGTRPSNPDKREAEAPDASVKTPTAPVSKYGTGITESEIDRIVSEFSRK